VLATLLVALAMVMPTGISKLPGFSQQSPGVNGVIRIEAFDYSHVGGLNFNCVGSPRILDNIGDAYDSAGTAVLVSSPFSPTPPSGGPSILKVTTINGVPVNANPFSFPDAVINSTSPVTVNVQANNIPVGVIPQIIVTSEVGATQAFACSALQGTLQQSTCSASVTFATGGSRGFVKATWTQ